MRLSSDILFDNLSRHTAIKRFGKDIKTLSLNPPMFYSHDLAYQNDMIYLGRASEMPPPNHTNCLLICVGTGIPHSWNPGNCCIFTVLDDTDILNIFNELQQIFLRFTQWDMELTRILNSNASITDMVRETALLIGNTITFINNRLEIEAATDPTSDDGQEYIGPVSEKDSRHFLGHHRQNTSMRRPFFYEIDGRRVYCYNLYKQETYLGLITMSNRNHPFLTGDFELFGYFYTYISAAAEKRLRITDDTFATLKTVFSHLLNSLPVNSHLISRALNSDSSSSDTEWICSAIQFSGQTEPLPAEYLCALLESRIPRSIAVFCAPYTALFVPLTKGSRNMDPVSVQLGTIVDELSMRAGVSNIFEDITQARFYFRQAVHATETSSLFSCEGNMSFFHDYALMYALRNCIGEFPPEYIMPSELLKLRIKGDQPGSVDYWQTLKIYLDNEMNITKTANELYIHRATLHTRLHKIQEMIDLDTPQKRMYIRLCLYLYEMYTDTGGVHSPLGNV